MDNTIFRPKSSGLTVKQWCEQNNFTIHTYNYWKHVLKEELAGQMLPDIVPITVPEPMAQILQSPSPDSCLANRAIRATGPKYFAGIYIVSATLTCVMGLIPWLPLLSLNTK